MLSCFKNKTTTILHNLKYNLLGTKPQRSQKRKKSIKFYPSSCQYRLVSSCMFISVLSGLLFSRTNHGLITLCTADSTRDLTKEPQANVRLAHLFRGRRYTISMWKETTILLNNSSASQTWKQTYLQCLPHTFLSHKFRKPSKTFLFGHRQLSNKTRLRCCLWGLHFILIF